MFLKHEAPQNLTHLVSQLRDNPEHLAPMGGGSASPKSSIAFAATWLVRRSEALLLGQGYHRASYRCQALSRMSSGGKTPFVIPRRLTVPRSRRK